MPKNYASLVENVKRRSNPDLLNESLLFSKSFSDELRGITDSGSKLLEYIKRSMQGVEPRYTERTFEAGDKIKEQLRKNNPGLDYKYQGSVMCNTHIKGHSDIDLVQITNSFYSHESITKFNEKYSSGYYLTLPQKQNLLEVINGTPYQGDTNADLKKIRTDAETVLVSTYKNVDTSKPKSIEVNPTNPDRVVDVVTASWYVNVNSAMNDDADLKGIQVYDKAKNTRLPVDFPFLKIRLLNEKDKSVNGRLKKMIRFVKTLKADSEYDLKQLSSFDISSVCYNINALDYYDKSYYELVFVLYSELKKIIENETYRNSIMSIDGSEPVFRGKDEKVRLLGLIFTEIASLYQDLLSRTSNVKFL
ncbi:hypothetical protein [Flavobacterium terrisoli]|uniref:hypothetical protein n=1 Tax=Flavobacterium terrisoli TaxID=3242195 RepID=UPI002543EFD0|nr:hypothetical protein [Flavobacterium buctense]